MDWPAFLTNDFMGRWGFVAGLIGLPSLWGLLSLRSRIGRQNAIIAGLEATVRDRDMMLKKHKREFSDLRAKNAAERPGSCVALMEREQLDGNFERAVHLGESYLRERSADQANLVLRLVELMVATLPREVPADRVAMIKNLATAGCFLDVTNQEMVALYSEIERLAGDPRIDLVSDLPSDYLARGEDVRRVMQELFRIITVLNRGRYSRITIALTKRGIAIVARNPSTPIADLDSLKHFLAHSLHSIQRHDEAEKVCRDQIASFKNRILPTSHTYISWRRLLATILVRSKRHAEAIAILEEILPAARLLTDEPDEQSLIETALVHNLARVAPARSVEVGRALVARLDATIGPLARITSSARFYLAEALRAAGHLKEALAIAEENQAAQDRIKGVRHPDAVENRKLSETIRSALNTSV